LWKGITRAAAGGPLWLAKWNPGVPKYHPRRRRSLASTAITTIITITAMVNTFTVRVAKSGSIILVTFPQDHQFGRAVLRVAD